MTTKLHLALTAQGHVVEGFLTGGQVADVTVADSLFEGVFGCYVVADRGYDAEAHRVFLRSQNNIPVIPGRQNRTVPIEYDKTIYALRTRIEQFFGKLKENKRLAMRYEQSDLVFLTFIALAAIMTLI